MFMASHTKLSKTRCLKDVDIKYLSGLLLNAPKNLEGFNNLDGNAQKSVIESFASQDMVYHKSEPVCQVLNGFVNSNPLTTRQIAEAKPKPKPKPRKRRTKKIDDSEESDNIIPRKRGRAASPLLTMESDEVQVYFGEPKKFREKVCIFNSCGNEYVGNC
jgi:hypothetical protein